MYKTVTFKPVTVTRCVVARTVSPRVVRILSPVVLVGHLLTVSPSFAVSRQPYVDMVNTLPYAETVLEEEMESIQRTAGNKEAKEIRNQIKHLQKEIENLESQEERMGVDSVIDKIKDIQEEIDQIMRLSHLY